jgi:ketosteroid isomerase-like protein
MSQENVEIVRRCFDAWMSGDSASALPLLSADIEFDVSTRPDGKVWHGPEGMRQAIAEWVGAWDEYTLETEDWLDAGGDRVVSLWREKGRAKQSGTPTAQEGATVFTLRDGLISSVRVSVDRARTLAETGLAPGMPDASGTR